MEFRRSCCRATVAQCCPFPAFEVLHCRWRITFGTAKALGWAKERCVSGRRRGTTDLPTARHDGAKWSNSRPWSIAIHLLTARSCSGERSKAPSPFLGCGLYRAARLDHAWLVPVWVVAHSFVLLSNHETQTPARTASRKVLYSISSGQNTRPMTSNERLGQQPCGRFGFESTFASSRRAHARRNSRPVVVRFLGARCRFT